jgi:guanylate kinase
MTDGRLVIFAGPSCIGKSPLAKSARRVLPGVAKAKEKELIS